MSGIGSTEAVYRIFRKAAVECGEIIRRNNAIAVEEYEVCAIGTFQTVVACYGTAFIVLVIISYIKIPGVFFNCRPSDYLYLTDNLTIQKIGLILI